MNYFKAFAFTKLDGLKAVGNPAHVVIFDEAETLDGKLMSDISSKKFGKFLITVFLKKRKNNEFDLRYYTQHGEEWKSLCGHATICAAGVLRKFHDKNFSEIIFHLSSGIVIKTQVDENGATIELPLSKTHLVDDKSVKEKICEILRIKTSAIDEIHKSEMMDYVVLVNDGAKVRNIIPSLKLLEEYAEFLNYRAMAVMQKSDEKNIDFEVRVFSHLALDKEEENGEDVACGSANCSIANVVKLDSYNVIYPYQFHTTKEFGGLQKIKLNKNSHTIKLTGGYEASRL